MHERKRMRSVIEIQSFERGYVVRKSTDDQPLVRKDTPPSVPLTKFVEVIGIADSDRSIRAEIWTNFGDNFDAYFFNQLCQLENGGYKHMFL